MEKKTEIISAYCDQILELYPPEKIILHQAYFTPLYKDAEGKTRMFSEEEWTKYQELNDFIDYLYTYCIKKMKCHVITQLPILLADVKNKWTLAPMHYVPDEYQHVLCELRNIVDRVSIASIHQYEEQAWKAKFQRLSTWANPIVPMEELPIGLGSGDMVSQFFSLEIQAGEDADCHLIYGEFQPHFFYSISLEVEASFPEYTLRFYDRKGKQIVLELVRPAEEKVCFSFRTMEAVEDIKLQVYAGIAGNTRGNTMFLKSMAVMQRPANAIGRREKDAAYWYDTCREALARYPWCGTLEDYDHHDLPWRMMSELLDLLKKFRPLRILELGLGEISKLLSRYARAVGGEHIIIDEDKKYCVEFLQRNARAFGSNKVYLSPLLDAKKDGLHYSAFRDFKKIVGRRSFHLILMRRPRGGGTAGFRTWILGRCCQTYWHGRACSS